MGFPNKVVGKAQLGDLIWRCYKICGHEKTVLTLDRLKELGFREATKSGCSIGIDDMIHPDRKKFRKSKAPKSRLPKSRSSTRKGVITPGERYNKIIDIWTHCTDQIANVMLRTLDHNQGKREYISCLFDGGFRRPRKSSTGSSACRCSRANGETLWRYYREADSFKLPRRTDRAGSTSSPLTAPAKVWLTRRSKPLTRVHDPQARRCGPGCNHPGSRLRHYPAGIWVEAIYEGEDEVVEAWRAPHWPLLPAMISTIHATRRPCSWGRLRKLTRSRRSSSRIPASRRGRSARLLTCESQSWRLCELLRTPTSLPGLQ